jgi:hypothetical protein
LAVISFFESNPVIKQRDSCNYNEIVYTRIREIAGYVKDMFSQLSIITGNSRYKLLSIELSQDLSFSEEGGMQAYKSRVSRSGGIDINVFSLLKAEDIPLKFRVANDNDLKLWDDNFLQDFIKWVKEYLRITSSVFLDTSVKLSVRNFLLMINNPELFKASKLFLLAHECAHLALDHFEQDSQRKQNSKGILNRYIWPITTGLGVCAISLIKMSIFPSLLFTGLVEIVAFAALPKLNSLRLSRVQESEADFYAKKIVGKDGGIFLFEGTKKEYKRLLTDPTISCWKRFLLNCSINKNGIMRFPFYLLNEHPECSNRIKALKS